MTMPTMLDLLREAERPSHAGALRDHQVTFPIYRDQQVKQLYATMEKNHVRPQQTRFLRTGLEVIFKNDSDALLIKLAFAAR
jgi:hypothetical protein